MRFRFLIFQLSALLLPLFGLLGQDTIQLINPSFEDFPGMGKPPRGWFDCQAKDFPNETLCDVHPGVYENYFDVVKRANHGFTYVGMVVRDNDSWESIAQKLTIPLQADKCYNFWIDLCKSPNYRSGKSSKGRRDTTKLYPFVEPVILRIWGGYSYCDKAELLDETNSVNSTDWRTYHFDLSPAGTYTHIILEAFYKTPVLFAYDGNILVDNASSITLKPCPGEEPIAVIQVDEKTEVSSKKVNSSSSMPSKPKEEPNAEEKILKDLDIAVLKEGQKVRIENLYFSVDESQIEESSYPVLEEIFAFLKNNKMVKVEIGGHTNQNCSENYCDKLSKARAKAVCDYLLDKGVSPARLSYKGYGKRFSLNEEKGDESRKKNQRVEIKILSLQG